MKILTQKKQDYILEMLIQLNETLTGIVNDVQGFKSIRHRLFLIASADKSTNKIYLYPFHIFESLISNLQVLVDKNISYYMSQLPNKFNFEVQSVDIDKKNEGFFQENLKCLANNQKKVQDIIDEITRDQLIKKNYYKKREQQLEKIIKEMSIYKNEDNSFEVKWSLQELENIVYDFINANYMPKEFEKFQDVKLEDLYKVKKQDKDGDGIQQLVRDYILHDRGNSIFLSESFGNLPSPIAESKTIKNLFKVKDEDDLKKNVKRKQDSSTYENKNIKIEGKNQEESSEKKMIDIDIDELDGYVFQEDSYIKQMIGQYQEEESYQNPQNLTFDDD